MPDAAIFEPNADAHGQHLGYLWGKLGYGALLFGTALTNASICDELDAREPRPLLRGARPARRPRSRTG